jgi:hypothetical protein
MNKKYFIFKFLLTQSSISLSTLNIKFERNKQTWTVTTAGAKITIQPFTYGTKFQIKHGNLLQSDTKTNSLTSFDSIYGAGHPINMKSFQLNPETTTLVWLAIIQQYHLLTFNDNDPENIIYSRISSLQPNELDSPQNATFKMLLQKDPYLNA